MCNVQYKQLTLFIDLRKVSCSMFCETKRQCTSTCYKSNDLCILTSSQYSANHKYGSTAIPQKNSNTKYRSKKC